MIFEAEVGAFLAVLLALDLPLAKLCEDLPGRPKRIYFQTPDALDDIVVDTDIGTVCVQVKRNPGFSASGSNNLGDVAHAIVAQYRAGHRQSGAPFNPARDRLLIVVGEQTTGSITRDLREALSRIATGSATAVPRSLEKSLGRFSSFLEAAWLRQAQQPISPNDLANVLALTRVIVVSPDGLRYASGLLRQHLAAAEDSEKIFAALKLWAMEMAHRGAGGDRQALIDLIERQCGTSHAFGRRHFPNLSSGEVSQIFEGLARDALSTLEHSRLYLPTRTVRRNHFHDEVSRFIAGSARLLPVVGVSGVGKTTALATLLGETGSALPSRWLVRGADSHAADDGIRSLVERSLERSHAAVDLKLTLDDFLAASPRPPLLILDALNEADAIPLRSLRYSWIPRSLDWLVAHDIRLVFSCRPDVWAVLADAFPSNLIHFPSPNGVGDETDSPITVQPREVFRLGDFSGTEAAQAVSLYGLSNWFPPDQVRHPFLLALAEELHSDGAGLKGGFATTIELFIRRRTSRAAEQLKYPSWIEPMLARLEDLAMAMLEHGTQSVEGSQGDGLFGAQAPAIEALIAENLLTRSEIGLRFQHDQVSEFLQAKRVTAGMIALELSPSPGRARRPGQSNRFLESLKETWSQIREYSVARRAELRRDRSLNPSIAAFAITRMLRTPNDSTAIRLLDGLFRSTHPYRTDHGFKWAAQTTQLVLDRIDPKTIAAAEVLGWLTKLLEREDPFYYSEWTLDIAAAAAGSLVRADLAPEVKLAFVPLLARQELRSWGVREIRSDAFAEAYGSHSPDWHPFAKYLGGTATGRLISHLSEMDFHGMVGAFGAYLNDVSDFARKNVRGHCRPPLARIAAISLYHFRALDIDAVCGAALGATSGPAADLVDGLAISNPAELGSVAIARLREASADEARRLHQVILIAAEHCQTGEGTDIITFALTALCSPEAATQISGARIFLERYTRLRGYASRLADANEANQLLDSMSWARELALTILSVSLACDPDDVTGDDYLRLLEERFDFALDVLEKQLDAERGPREEGISAVLRYISRVKLKDGRDRLERAKMLMRWLHSYADVRRSEAFDRLAEFVLVEVQHAGQSEYYVSKSQLHELAIPELARRIIRSASEGVMHEIARRGWPFLEEMRDFFFGEVTALSLPDEDLEQLVHNLFIRTSRDCPNPFERIVSLRRHGREDAWDRAGRKYLWGGGKLANDLIRYWVALPPEDLSPISQMIVSRVADGMTPRMGQLAGFLRHEFASSL